MLVAGFVARIPYMALTIASLISMEMSKGMITAGGQWADVAVMGIVTVIHVAEEAAGTVEPGAGTDEDSADKPVGPIVAIRSAVIRRIVEVPVGAIGSRTKVHTDRDLGLCGWGKTHHQNGESSESKQLPTGHTTS
jgi:hypothetical protein